MPVVICPTHGEHCAPLICKHLAAAVGDRRPIRRIVSVEAWYLGERAWIEHLCEECARTNGLTEDRITMRDDDSLDRLFAMKIDVVPVCSKCLEASREMQGLGGF